MQFDREYILLNTFINISTQCFIISRLGNLSLQEGCFSNYLLKILTIRLRVRVRVRVRVRLRVRVILYKSLKPFYVTQKRHRVLFSMSLLCTEPLKSFKNVSNIKSKPQ